MGFFFFEFVYVVDFIDGFPYIEPSLNLWDEAYLIIVNDHFDVFLNLVDKNFIHYFCIYIHKGNWSEALFLCSKSTIGLSTRSPVEELEKGLKELKELEAHRRNNNMDQPVLPELLETKPPTKEYTRRDPWTQLSM